MADSATDRDHRWFLPAGAAVYRITALRQPPAALRVAASKAWSAMGPFEQKQSYATSSKRFKRIHELPRRSCGLCSSDAGQPLGREDREMMGWPAVRMPFP